MDELRESELYVRDDVIAAMRNVIPVESLLAHASGTTPVEAFAPYRPKAERTFGALRDLVWQQVIHELCYLAVRDRSRWTRRDRA